MLDLSKKNHDIFFIIINDFFSIGLAVYATIIIAENIQEGFFSDYININNLLFIIIAVGALSIYYKKLINIK